MGKALGAPGGLHLEIVRDDEGCLRAQILPAVGATLRYTPSIDRLFASVAMACGSAAA